MSRTSILSRSPGPLSCALCGNAIEHDVARVDEGRVYHVRCFRRHVTDSERTLYDCPKCATIGGTWSWSRHAWETCDLCAGSGYLSSDDARRGA